MNFPTFKSLQERAKQRNFRQPIANECEAHYREAFSIFMQPVDRLESAEISNKDGLYSKDPADILSDMGIDMSSLFDI
jgi:hypothetical protein